MLLLYIVDICLLICGGVKVHFSQSFPAQANGRWYLLLCWTGGVKLEQHRGLFSFFFFKFERGSPLINGSIDAPATSHSGHHNRQTYEAEPGMEYWRNEWEHTHKRPDITPVRSYSVLLIVCLCWRGSAAGVSFFSNYWRSQRLRQDVEKLVWRVFGGTVSK